MEFIEQVAKEYEHTIAALSSFGTWAAVFVALWIARKSVTPRLEVFVSKSKFVPSEAQINGVVDERLCSTGVSVAMQNKGSVPVHIDYWAFSWMAPWPWRISAQQNPWYPIFKSQPIQLNPGQGTSVFLTNDVKKHKETLAGLCKENRLPFFMRRFIRLFVIAQDGTSFKAKFSKTYKDEFFKR